MKKITKEYINKTIIELEKQIELLKEEIAKLRLNEKVNPPKDINLIYKKRKKLAVLLTLLTQKKELAVLQSNKTKKSHEKNSNR